jgi:tetratricopeptide (TPR) repeat protein
MEQDTLGAAVKGAPDILGDPPAALASEGERRLRRRRVRTGIAALLLAAVSATGAWIVLRQTPWYAERHYARLSLAQLQAEGAGGKGENNPRLLYYLGRRLNEQQRFAQADPILRQAVGLDPDSPRLRDEWARALLGSGLTTAAFGQLREFAGTHPDSADAHLLVGKFYFTQNSMKRASEELERAVSLNPSLADGWAYLAGAADVLGDAKRAREAAEKAVALRPERAQYRLTLAGFLAASGNEAAARREYEEAVRLGPKNAAVHREYAQWLLSTGRGGDAVRRAEEHAHQAVSLDGTDAAAQIVLGRALSQNGDDAGAVPVLERAAALAPYEPAPALALSQALRRLRRAKDARTWEAAYLSRQRGKTEEGRLRDKIRVAPDARKPRIEMARLLARRGDVVGCVRQHAAARRVALDAPAALIAAANDLTDAGRPALALAARPPRHQGRPRQSDGPRGARQRFARPKQRAGGRRLL